MDKNLDSLWLEEIEPHIDGKIIRYLRTHHERYGKLLQKHEELLENYPVLVSVINDEEKITLDQEEHRALRRFMTVQNEMDSIVVRYSYFFGQARMLDYFELLKDLYDKSKQDHGKKEERGDKRMPTSDPEEKELIAATLNGLEVYAKEIAQDTWEPLIKIRDIIKEMSSYWDMQEEKDWERSFDNHVLLSYFDRKAEPIPDEEKQRVIQGLVHYIEEMECTHGDEDAGRIHEIRQLIAEITARWEMNTDQLFEE